MPGELARPLPEHDVRALFDVVVVLVGEVLAGQAPPGMVDKMIRRLAGDGFLPADASAGELASVIEDLAQRLHYAMGSHDALPGPVPRMMTHSVAAPTRSAALACRDNLIALGGSDVVVREREGEWEVMAAFPDLPPDPSFGARVAQLADLAGRHRSKYHGCQR